MSVKHNGLPVSGYRAQSPANIAVVNGNKELEERVLRRIDAMQSNAHAADHDPRMIALARTAIQEGFMWLNRAVFQPERISLPEDPEAI